MLASASAITAKGKRFAQARSARGLTTVSTLIRTFLGRPIVCQSSLLLPTEYDDGLERQLQRLAEGVKRPEGRMSTSSEHVAQGSLVDVSLPREIPARPATQDSSSIDRCSINPPFQEWALRHTRLSRLARTRSRKSRPVASMYSPTRRRDTSIATSRSLTPATAARELA